MIFWERETFDGLIAYTLDMEIFPIADNAPFIPTEDYGGPEWVKYVTLIILALVVVFIYWRLKE